MVAVTGAAFALTFSSPAQAQLCGPDSAACVTVDELYRFARDSLHLDFIFWGTEEPYYSADVLPYLKALSR